MTAADQRKGKREGSQPLPDGADVIPAEPADLTRAVERAEAEGERVIITRDGKPVAAVVPISDAETLEALDDVRDTGAVRSALAAYARDGKSWAAL